MKEIIMEQIILDIPNGYEFFGINDDNKVVLTKKQPQYPKDYEECCEVLGYSGNYNMILTTDIDCKLFNALYRLKVCRDAYWEIAGEQLGLDKPWEPDWKSEQEYYTLKYTIFAEASKILVGSTIQYNAILAFPTAEMRDSFHENFRELIEQCKELL